MDMQLADRHALITGSSYGIGYAIARALAAEGARVTLTARTQAGVDAALERLAKAVPGAKADGVAADCASADGARQVFERVPEVDILVNNLGIYERKPFTDIGDGDWQRLFDVNVMSGVRFTRFYAPKMAKRGWGRVIFVSSESGLNIPPDMIHYGMTKSAQLAVSRGLAVAYAGTGVTVNALLPGPTRTDTTEQQRAQRARAAAGGGFLRVAATEFPDQAIRRRRRSRAARRLPVQSAVGADHRRGAARRGRHRQPDHVSPGTGRNRRNCAAQPRAFSVRPKKKRSNHSWARRFASAICAGLIRAPSALRSNSALMSKLIDDAR
jgi:NAD(P)-dependent dehydrogenase (short-subunit alcohol dehydrogenase family)